MIRAAVRRFFFGNLAVNLACILGISQVLVGHWLAVVAGGGEAVGFPWAIALACLLSAGNALAVPAIRRGRRRGGWVGVAARGYVAIAVATLLLGAAVAATWLVFPLLSGLLGAVGASSDTVFRAFRVASVGVVGAVAGALAWGFTRGQAVLDHTHLRVEIPGLHPALAGLRIVHISDLHIGSGFDSRRLRRMVAMVNALRPDVIAVTGDIFDSDPGAIDEGARGLAALRARFGVYAVLGNHDRAVGMDCVERGLGREAPGIELLRNRRVRVPAPAPLYLAGVEDPGGDWSARGIELEGLAQVAAARPDDGPTLLLAHHPEVLLQAARFGFPLLLAGHTHGGQIALPTPGGRYNLARLTTRFTRGLFRKGRTTMYVNRGLGVGGLALRVNCAREIATIELAVGVGEGGDVAPEHGGAGAGARADVNR